MADDTKRLVYQTILSHAVVFANQDPRKPWYLGGAIFREPTTYDHLELRFDPTILTAIADARNRHGEMRSEDEIMELLALIVKDAVTKAIGAVPEAGEALAALIVHQARNQVNVEDWF